jgi:hypothetical protein
MIGSGIITRGKVMSAGPSSHVGFLKDADKGLRLSSGQTYGNFGTLNENDGFLIGNASKYNVSLR